MNDNVTTDLVTRYNEALTRVPTSQRSRETRTARITNIIVLHQGGAPVYVKALAALFDVSLQMIYSDLKALRASGYEIAATTAVDAALKYINSTPKDEEIA